MSKIIDSLKESVKELSRSQTETAPQQVRTSQELTQEQLGEIYFSNTDKSRRQDQPLVIKVIEKERVVSIVPWLVSSVALLMMAFALFSTKRIFVDVRVMDDKNLAASDWQAAPAKPAVSPVREEGTPLMVENFVFEGAAKIKSSKVGRELTLANSSVAPFAKASLFLEEPVDFSKFKIVFYARGERGGENLAVALKDVDNHLAFDKGKWFPFPSKLSTSWQRAEIKLSGVPEGFDKQRVTSLRFEFGSKDADNRPEDSLLVRDIQVVSL